MTRNLTTHEVIKRALSRVIAQFEIKVFRENFLAGKGGRL